MTSYISLVRQPVFDSLENRVDTLESDITAAEGRIAGIEPTVALALTQADAQVGLSLLQLNLARAAESGTIALANSTSATALSTAAAADEAAPPRLNDLLMIGL